MGQASCCNVVSTKPASAEVGDPPPPSPGPRSPTSPPCDDECGPYGEEPLDAQWLSRCTAFRTTVQQPPAAEAPEASGTPLRFLADDRYLRGSLGPMAGSTAGDSPASVTTTARSPALHLARLSGAHARHSPHQRMMSGDSVEHSSARGEGSVFATPPSPPLPMRCSTQLFTESSSKHSNTPPDLV